MRTVILSWNGGENDPFTVMNAALARHLRACGKDVEIVELSDPDWVVRIADLCPAGIDFALTWQGMGSATEVDVNEGRRNYWELMRVPLICIHGDHPSHNPVNHQVEGRYCFHLHTDPEFAHYSNRHFRKTRSAGLIDMPALHQEPPLNWPAGGDCFVMAKNIVDPVDIEEAWRKRFDRSFFEYHMAALETLRARIDGETHVDVHRTVDEFLGEAAIAEIMANSGPDVFHEFHSRMDYYARNYRSVRALAAIKEFPVKVHGRGWERIARSAPRSHTFLPGLNMAESQALFYTRFGIVDISPASVLHDRTLRAMANGTGFLSSASPRGLFHDSGKFSRLFFSIGDGDLAAKCAAVMADPAGHRSLAGDFAAAYFDKFHVRRFVNTLDLLAKSVDRF